MANKKVEKKTNKKTTKKEEVVKVVMKDERVVPFINYIIMAVILVVVTAAVFGLRAWYHSYQDYQLTVPVLKGTISQVKPDEIFNYITENNDSYIYIEVTSDANSREVASKLKKLLKERNIIDKTVFVSVETKKEAKEVINKINDKYNDNKDITNYPAFIIIRDKKVKDFKSRTKQKLLPGDIEQLLDEYEIEG